MRKMKDESLNVGGKPYLLRVNQSGQLESFGEDGGGITPDELSAAPGASENSGFADVLMNAFYTFNIFPVSEARDVEDEDPSEGIASDWNNVFTDLSVAFMREATGSDKPPEPPVDG